MLRCAVRFANSASSIRTLTVGPGFAPGQPCVHAACRRLTHRVADFRLGCGLRRAYPVTASEDFHLALKQNSMGPSLAAPPWLRNRLGYGCFPRFGGPTYGERLWEISLERLAFLPKRYAIRFFAETLAAWGEGGSIISCSRP